MTSHGHYDHHTLDSSPFIQVNNDRSNDEMPTTDAEVFFYSSKPNIEPDSFVYSQFTTVTIYDPDLALTFNCNEQYYQYRKALVFVETGCQRNPAHPKNIDLSIEERPAKILKQTSALNQKALVADIVFNEDGWRKWKAMQWDVLLRANWLKFRHNQDARKWLESTGNRTMIEASPGDKVCGIGYAYPLALKRRSQWGENLLGKAIQKVREDLRNLSAEELQKIRSEDALPTAGRMPPQRRLGPDSARLQGRPSGVPARPLGMTVAGPGSNTARASQAEVDAEKRLLPFAPWQSRWTQGTDSSTAPQVAAPTNRASTTQHSGELFNRETAEISPLEEAITWAQDYRDKRTGHKHKRYTRQQPS